ncbi:PilW family protein [Roseateles sp. BYS87W]|uniref:PilW family protein n=1 Tax=Pelomonas baiyunensis TaxID=3299026 RepID=A0ABW7GUC2_9BURK
MSRATTLRPNRGFTLVELMVGIVVALAAALVVTEIFKVSEGQRRATSGGDDAQTTGAIAISLMQRDLRQAGQGFSTANLLDCQLDLGNSRTFPELAPVSINPPGIAAGDADTDVLVVAYGSGSGLPEGTLINTQPGAATYAVAAPQAFRLGDRVVAAPATRAASCALNLTTVSANPTATSVQVAFGMANASNGVLYNLGNAPRFVAYSVRGSQLTVCDFATQDCTNSSLTNWTEVADGIVGLRAEYARDTSVPRDTIADVYDRTAPATVCAWSRVVGVRLAIVARSRQAEKANVAASAPSWSGSAPLTLSNVNADWQRYRYKTFETTMPLRNLPGATDPNFAACP